MKLAAVVFVAASWMAWSALSSAAIAGEVRTLSLYQVHTKESLTVTYKKNGRYIPSAMKKLNHILRDWRRDATIKIDPKTIDLMWELHADLGSRKPIHIISGYRSSKTNAMLKRIGRRVARRSRHIKGQAIDMYFPDVPTSKVRGSALVRKVGGVGYYPRSGKNGFVHIDTGTVRHWPRVSKTRLAKIQRTYRKTVGARRYSKKQPVMVASATTKKGPVSITPKVLGKPFTLASTRVPKPRNRPMEVIVLAAATVQVTPASAPVPSRNFSDTAPRLADMASLVTATTTPAPEHQRSNISAKGSLAKSILNGTEETTPTIRPLLAAKKQQNEELDSWWPLQLLATADSLFRRDGTPQPFERDDSGKTVLTDDDAIALKSVIASMAPGNEIRVEAANPVQASAVSGKADKLQVNRAGKSDLLMHAPITLLKRQTSSAAQAKGDNIAQLDARAEAILQSIEKPISFE
ncbi:MAG: DUF882 domain-containing protein [Rhizobiales bacterium]|nr:DUF882 domain-containing protein [Hyphomicrobiales bacterium]